MHPAIIEITEGPRGCGYRDPGRMYLVSDGVSRHCGKMPIPMEVCPCCGMGIRPSRAPRMLETPYRLWDSLSCTADSEHCATCPLRDGHNPGPALLIWIGEKFYPTPEAFSKESRMMGISRYIRHIPRGFEVGKTWVLLAHRKGIALPAELFDEPTYQPAIFSVFKPTRIEIAVTGEESDEEIEGYLERGLTPVKVTHWKPDKEPEEESGADQPSLF